MIDQSRLEQGTSPPPNPDRPRKKPFGRGFWGLIAVFLFVGSAVATVVFGFLVINTVSGPSDQPAPPAKAAPPTAVPDQSAPAEKPDETGLRQSTQSSPKTDMLSGGGRGQAGAETRADGFYQDEKGVWRNTTGPSKPVFTGSEEIYQDDSGTWRNASRRSAPAPSAAGSGNSADLISQLGSLDPGNSADLISQLGSLLGGGQSASGGGELDSLLGTLSTLAGGSDGQAGNVGDMFSLLGSLAGLAGGSAGDQAGASGLGSLLGGLMGDTSSGSADLGSLLGGLTGGSSADSVDLGSLLGGLSSSLGDYTTGSAGGTDLKSMLEIMGGTGDPNAGLSSGSGSGSSGLRPNTIKVTAPKAAASPRPDAVSDQTGGLNLEGYEAFDPTAAGQVKSDWDFFEDPR